MRGEDNDNEFLKSTKGCVLSGDGDSGGDSFAQSTLMTASHSSDAYHGRTSTNVISPSSASPPRPHRHTPTFLELFPYPSGPYPQQHALMSTIMEGIPPPPPPPPPVASGRTPYSSPATSLSSKSSSTTRVLACESPTGTGKSLSLACASLAWLLREEQRYWHENRNKNIDDEDGEEDAFPSEQQPSTSNCGVLRGQSTKQNGPSKIGGGSSSTGISWLDDWQPPAQDDEDENNKMHLAASSITTSTSTTPRSVTCMEKSEFLKKKTMNKNRERMTRHDQLLNKLSQLRVQCTTSTTNTEGQPGKTEKDGILLQRRENLLRQALAKVAMEEKKRNRRKKRKRVLPSPSLSYKSDDDDNDGVGNSRGVAAGEDGVEEEGTAEWLLRTNLEEERNHTLDRRRGQNQSPTSTKNTSSSSPPPPPPQIIYAARTHSQLSQFVEEIRKIHYHHNNNCHSHQQHKDAADLNVDLSTTTSGIGRSLRVVALASRSQGLCGQFTSNKSNDNQRQMMSDTRLTEECLELRKSKPSKSTPMSSFCGCPYYTSKENISTLALHSLVVPTDVEDMSRLGKSSKTCAYYATRVALPHAQLITVPYSLLCNTRENNAKQLGLTFHENTLVIVDEAHNLPDAISSLQSAMLTLHQVQAAQEQLRLYLTKYMQQLNPHNLRQLGQLKCFLDGIAASMKTAARPSTTGSDGGKSTERRRYLLTSNEYLVSNQLETINIFRVLSYMGETRLSQKLLGFMPRQKQQPKKTSTESTITSLPSSSQKASPSRNLQPEKSFELFTSKHISPMSIVERFMEKFLYESNNDGQVVVDVTTPGEEHVKFVVLNPAVLARDDLWTKPRAVCLVGGTLQPLSVMMQELVPDLAMDARNAEALFRNTNKSISRQSATITVNNTYSKYSNQSTSRKVTTQRRSTIQDHCLFKSQKFWAFTCGHVVDPSHVLLQSLTDVHGTAIDVRYQTRSTPAVCNAVGKAIVQLSTTVPYGVVVFLPSYKYEKVLVESWKKSTIWDQLCRGTTVVREPKEASQVEQTLSKFANAATASREGALLMSVVGGKLSEGINFANDLCRCVVVVGLPFADRSDPLLQEKLKLVSDEREYYLSMCLRGVNQSVGRAIRHANDYASIVLMDVRYPRDNSIANSLPGWLTESTPNWRSDSTSLPDVVSRLDGFFKTMREKDDVQNDT